ncbi:hypothetical protein QMM61_16185, partial [Leptospira santarosai]|nr:hypothetical protein [Leptospira santarosai]
RFDFSLSCLNFSFLFIFLFFSQKKGQPISGKDNLSAKDVIISLASENVNIIEMEKDIKHEGIIIAYKLEIKWFPILLRKPSWSS